MSEPSFDGYGDPTEPPQPQGSNGPKELREAFDRAKTENKQLKQENALLKAGLGDLPEVRQKALLAAHTGDMTGDALLKTAVDLGFAEPPPPPAPPQASPQERSAETVEQIASDAAGGTPVERGAITPEDANSWPVDRMMRFREQYPQQWEQLLRGETVTGIPHT